MSSERTCAYPGCEKVLSHANRSGVCKAHNHAAGACQCRYCVGPEAAERQRKASEAARAHLRPVAAGAPSNKLALKNMLRSNETAPNSHVQDKPVVYRLPSYADCDTVPLRLLCAPLSGQADPWDRGFGNQRILKKANHG